MRFAKLLLSLLLCYLVAFFGSIATFSAITTWYVTLQKPFFNPQNQIFGPVWTLLYTLMGISFFLIWEKGFKTKKAQKARNVFFLQLGLNFLWSFVFFSLHNIFFALVVIIALWISILWTIRLFWGISPRAGNLLVPYLCWVSFATVLNFALMLLN